MHLLDSLALASYACATARPRVLPCSARCYLTAHHSFTGQHTASMTHDATAPPDPAMPPCCPTRQAQLHQTNAEHAEMRVRHAEADVAAEVERRMAAAAANRAMWPQPVKEEISRLEAKVEAVQGMLAVVQVGGAAAAAGSCGQAQAVCSITSGLRHGRHFLDAGMDVSARTGHC